MVLDEPYNSSTAAQRDGTGNVAKKIRRNGEPSNSLPPVNAPHWAVNSEFRNASSCTGMLLL